MPRFAKRFVEVKKNKHHHHHQQQQQKQWSKLNEESLSISSIGYDTDSGDIGTNSHHSCYEAAVTKFRTKIPTKEMKAFVEENVTMSKTRVKKWISNKKIPKNERFRQFDDSFGQSEDEVGEEKRHDYSLKNSSSLALTSSRSEHISRGRERKHSRQLNDTLNVSSAVSQESLLALTSSSEHITCRDGRQHMHFSSKNAHSTPTKTPVLLMSASEHHRDSGRKHVKFVTSLLLSNRDDGVSTADHDDDEDDDDNGSVSDSSIDSFGIERTEKTTTDDAAADPPASKRGECFFTKPFAQFEVLSDYSSTSFESFASFASNNDSSGEEQNNKNNEEDDSNAQYDNKNNKKVDEEKQQEEEQETNSPKKEPLLILEVPPPLPNKKAPWYQTSSCMMINNQRRQHGLGPLKLNTHLNDAAGAMAALMAKSSSSSSSSANDNSSGNSSSNDSISSDNKVPYLGYVIRGESIQAVHQAMFNGTKDLNRSAAILDADLEELGAGIANGKNGAVYLCHLFLKHHHTLMCVDVF